MAKSIYSIETLGARSQGLYGGKWNFFSKGTIPLLGPHLVQISNDSAQGLGGSALHKIWNFTMGPMATSDWLMATDKHTSKKNPNLKGHLNHPSQQTPVPISTKFFPNVKRDLGCIWWKFQTVSSIRSNGRGPKPLDFRSFLGKTITIASLLSG